MAMWGLVTMPRCNGFCYWIKSHGQLDHTAYTYTYLALRHVHTHMHTYTQSHSHKHMTIDTYTRHICRGFRACPNGRVQHDAAHIYVYLGVGRVSLPVRDGAGLLPIHILVHIDIHSSSLPHILCTFVLAFGLVPMAVCNCVSCTAVASAFWRISLHRLKDNATNDLHGKISKATFAIVMRMTGHIHAQDHNSRNHLHSVFKCTLVVWLTRKYAEVPFLSPCCLAYRTLKAARLKYKKHRIGAESWNSLFS